MTPKVRIIEISPIYSQGLSIRFFVTGTSEHLGSALVPHLLERGHEVVELAPATPKRSST